MINAMIFGLISIGIGTLFAIPAIALGYWLHKSHIAPNRFGLSLLFCVVMVFIKRIWFPSLPYGLLGLIAILGSTLGVYRMDIYWAIKRENSEK